MRSDRVSGVGGGGGGYSQSILLKRIALVAGALTARVLAPYFQTFVGLIICEPPLLTNSHVSTGVTESPFLGAIFSNVRGA